jgi:4-hydroxybenzoate polyprenyltransferase
MQAAHVSFGAVAVVQILLLTLPMNLVGCGWNDIFDYESDRRCGRRRALWGAVIAPEDRAFVWSACAASAVVVVAGACLSLNWQNVAAAIGLIGMAWLYSVPPIRFKERPPLDSLANGIGYCLLPLAMGYSLGADVRTIPVRYLFMAICVCGVHALATAVDYEADKAVGHRTIAVVAGRRAAAAFAFVAFLVTWLCVEFQTPAVRVFIASSTIATGAAAIVPRHRVILAACVVVFVGFLIAAALDVLRV